MILEAAGASSVIQVDFTSSVLKVVLQKSIFPQVRQLIVYTHIKNELADCLGFDFFETTLLGRRV